MCPPVLRQVGASNGQFSESTGRGMQGRSEMHLQRETHLDSVSGQPCPGCTGLEWENGCPAFSSRKETDDTGALVQVLGESNVSWVHNDGAAHLKISRDRIKGDQRKEYGN